MPLHFIKNLFFFLDRFIKKTEY